MVAKLLAALLFAAAATVYVVDRELPERAARRAESRAYQALQKRGPVRENEIDRLKKVSGDEFNAGARSAVKGGTLVDSRSELTISQLMTSMEGTLGGVPSYVPSLPFISSLARTMLENDPRSIRFASLPEGTLGQFRVSDPMKPEILLSSKLQEYYLKGVPATLIVPVLVHELDHLLAYILMATRKKPQTEIEERAFRAEGLYLFALRKKFGTSEEDAVDASHFDPEDADARRYADELKMIRQKLFRGELPDMIKQMYRTGSSRP